MFFDNCIEEKQFRQVNVVVKYASRIDSILIFYGQATKGVRWMPRQREAMKDVVSCDKLRGAAKQALIRRFPNGETRQG